MVIFMLSLGPHEIFKKLTAMKQNEIFIESSILLRTHLPITHMRNRDQYKLSIRGVSGLALEESKMHTISRIQWIIFSEKYSCKT